jgi:hypothetical protein
MMTTNSEKRVERHLRQREDRRAEADADDRQ